MKYIITEIINTLFSFAKNLTKAGEIEKENTNEKGRDRNKKTPAQCGWNH